MDMAKGNESQKRLGTCYSHLCKKRTEVHKCKYCEEFFCKEHLEPKPAGGPRFSGTSHLDRLFMKEWHKEGGHPCIPYLKHWEEENKQEGERYDKALDNFLKSKQLEDNKERPDLVGQVKHFTRKSSDNKVDSEINESDSFLSSGYKSFKRWLNGRDHYPYDFSRRVNYIVMTCLFFILALVCFTIFYSNAQKINSINLWIIRLAGILLLVSLFFIIKYGWRILGELYNFYIRQRGWIIYLVIFIILILLWQGYTHRDTAINPVFNFYNNTNFSLFTPIDLTYFKNLSSDGGSNVATSLNNIFKTDPEQYQTNPKTIRFNNFNFVVYGGVNDYLSGLDRSISYYTTPPTDRDFIMRNLDNEIQRPYLLHFVHKIQEQSTDVDEQARIAINIVQGIPYDWDAFNTNSVADRYPYEVLYDMKGVCMEKADLLAFILRDLGFGVTIFEFKAENHRAVGIKCNHGNYNTNYCFIESTDYYPIGEIPPNYVGGADIINAVPEVITISDGQSFNQ